jgi:ketosteroid isomerase-like protein
MVAQQNSKAEKEIRAAMDQLKHANLKGGAEGATIFDKYYADDYARIAPNGAIYNKAETIDANRTGSQHVEAQDLSDVKVHIYGNTAVVTGILNSKSAGPMSGGKNLEPRQSRFTRVFVKRGGIWQCVLYQSTSIAKPANAQASNNAPPSYVANPANYKVIGENDLFRVILEKKPVGVRDPWHSHLDSAVYNLTDCHQMVYLPDGTTRERTLEKGSVVWQAAMTHSTENIGTSECVMLLVEHK